MATQQESAPQGAAEATQEKGKELVSKAQEQVQTKTHELRGEAEFQVREQVEQRSTQLGRQVQSVGHALRNSSQQLQNDGKETPAKLVEQVAGKADNLGSYLQEADADRILHDVESFARRRPWLTAGIGAAAGFLASRFVKASSNRRYEAYRDNGGYETRATSRMRITTSGGGA
jgi:ElaB/YqjD/DUF883 family membrane-anchored ribosome-binding protein